MGWLFSHRSRRELIAALIQTDDTEHYQHVTLAHALRGNVLWSVVQSTPKDPAKVARTVIHCTLMQGSGGSWGYKAMDESVHPYYYSCPKRYLTMAPEVCSEWREKVLAHHQRRYPQRGVIKEEEPVIAITPLLRFGLQCSSAHISEDDNTVLYRTSHCQDEFSDGEWISFSGTGYLLRLDAWTHPVLQLKRLGLSKTCRRLVTTLMKRYQLTYLHIDALGDVLPDFTTFDW